MHKCLFRHSRRFVKAARRGTIVATGFILLPEYYTSLTFLVAACAACAVGTACSPARCEFYKCIMSACCADLRFICQHIFTSFHITVSMIMTQAYGWQRSIDFYVHKISCRPPSFPAKFSKLTIKSLLFVKTDFTIHPCLFNKNDTYTCIRKQKTLCMILKDPTQCFMFLRKLFKY